MAAPSLPIVLGSPLDAWASIGQPGEGQEALEWLESQTPPALTVSESSKRNPVETFVPVNDEESLPVNRLRLPRHFPSVTPEKPEVHFIWPEALPTPVQVTALTALAANVTYLGHSASKVIVSAVENAPEPNIVPDASGNSVLRVPAAGRFRSCVRRGTSTAARVLDGPSRIAGLVMITNVQLPGSLRKTFWAKNTMERLFPEPCVCLTTAF